MVKSGIVVLPKTISTMNELVEVKELRERYMYNINPWVSHMAKRGLRLFYTESDVEETDTDDEDADGKSSTAGANNNGGGIKDNLRTKGKIPMAYIVYCAQPRSSIESAKGGKKAI